MPTSGDWDYTIAENAARITKYHGSAKDIVIPSTLGGYTVKRVGSGNTASNPVFDNSNLVADTTITFPDTVTAIGQYAFYGCNKIVGTLELPSNLTYIDQYAFTNCTGLTGVLSIPSRVYNIGYDAFLWCSHITKIIFKERVSSQQLFIYGSAFYGCYAVTEIQFEGDAYWKTSGARNPYLYNSAFAIGMSGHIVRATVYSENNMLNSALNNYKNNYTYFTYVATPVPPPPHQALKLGSDTTVYGTLTVNNGLTSLKVNNLSNAVLVADAQGNVSGDSSVDLTELGYLDGLFDNVQTQLDGKLNGIQFGNAHIEVTTVGADHYSEGGISADDAIAALGFEIIPVYITDEED